MISVLSFKHMNGLFQNSKFLFISIFSEDKVIGHYQKLLGISKGLAIVK